MTQKVNQGGNVASELEVKPETWMYGLIIGLSILVLALLIIIIKYDTPQTVKPQEKRIE